jgi:hypothetical protein
MEKYDKLKSRCDKFLRETKKSRYDDLSTKKQNTLIKILIYMTKILSIECTTDGVAKKILIDFFDNYDQIFNLQVCCSVMYDNENRSRKYMVVKLCEDKKGTWRYEPYSLWNTFRSNVCTYVITNDVKEKLTANKINSYLGYEKPGCDMIKHLVQFITKMDNITDDSLLVIVEYVAVYDLNKDRCRQILYFMSTIYSKMTNKDIFWITFLSNTSNQEFVLDIITSIRPIYKKDMKQTTYDKLLYKNGIDDYKKGCSVESIKNVDITDDHLENIACKLLLFIERIYPIPYEAYKVICKQKLLIEKMLDENFDFFNDICDIVAEYSDDDVITLSALINAGYYTDKKTIALAEKSNNIMCVALLK